MPRIGADADDPPPSVSEIALAQKFVERHGDDFRYVARWGRWLSWTGVHWTFDDTLHVFDLAREICAEAAAEIGDEKKSEARRISTAQTVAAVERLAKANRKIAATVDHWDTDQWLLNTPGGTVDLRTGSLRDHRREDYITKTTSTTPNGDCPHWMAVLDRTFRGDTELIAFVQRFLGYALTGSTTEHALAVGIGVGANGKSTIINTARGILGDFAQVASGDTFTVTGGDRHPTELAMLRGARLVVASETEEGRRWAEARIKALTGGDPITARFMRQDFFEFVPSFKLLIVSNHKPHLRNVDEAMRRRINIIPFEVVIPPAERDPNLAEKLRAEWPGILRWMLDGCLEWQHTGLAPPAAVRIATEEYLEAEDAFGLWLAECVEARPDRYETTAELFASWRSFADRTGEHAGSQKRFSEIMQTRGFRPKRQGGTGRQGFAGVLLRRPDYSEDTRHGQ